MIAMVMRMRVIVHRQTGLFFGLDARRVRAVRQWGAERRVVLAVGKIGEQESHSGANYDIMPVVCRFEYTWWLSIVKDDDGWKTAYVCSPCYVRLQPMMLLQEE
jgi:hypothetical protein